MNTEAKISLTPRGLRIEFDGHTRRAPRKVELSASKARTIADHFHGVGARASKPITIPLDSRCNRFLRVARIDGAPTEWLHFRVEHSEGFDTERLRGIVQVPAFARYVRKATRNAVAPEPRRISSGPYAGALRLKSPTQKHRPAMWEGILGAVYAMNDKRVIKYFDFDYKGARAWCGIEGEGRDPRTARGQEYSWDTRGGTPDEGVPTGRRVYICWVVDAKHIK